MAKHLHIAKLLSQRISHGDYVLQRFPTDRDLAAEVGASTVVVRKAVQHLIDEGLLIRQANGRPAVNRDGAEAKARLSIALLAEAYPSPVLERWHQNIEQAASERDWLMRVVGYSHQEDPLIQRTLEGFDGVFFMPDVHRPSASLVERLDQSPHPVVVLDNDWSDEGIRSMWLISPVAVQRLLDQVYQRRQREVVCLNTQPVTRVIEQRIEQWQLWTAAHGQSSRLLNAPVEPFQSASRHAYRVVDAQLSAGELGGTTIFCITAAAARGAMRALYEHGVAIGRDIGLCAAEDDGGQASLWTPSLTAVQQPDAKPYLSVCLDWMARGGRDWLGPMLVEPAQAPIFTGESTGGGGQFLT